MNRMLEKLMRIAYSETEEWVKALRWEEQLANPPSSLL